MKGRYRAANGNIMLLTVAIACFVILPTIMTTSQIALYYIDRTRSQNCVEAACLLAANDLSRIFIDDPHFGFVSLSNYPPVGKATAAEDGEPLPVIGINTLVGTVRQNTIVAEELGNHYMARLAEEDRTHLDETIKKLNGALSRALEEDKNVGLEDIHGNKIDPMKDVKALLQATLPDNLTVESVEMETGWLQEGTESTQDIPKPYHLARVKPEQIHRGKYKPFINIPAGRHSFTFAGLAENSTQVNPVLFQEQEAHLLNCSPQVRGFIEEHGEFLSLFRSGRKAQNHLRRLLSTLLPARYRPERGHDIALHQWSGAGSILMEGIPGLRQFSEQSNHRLRSGRW